MNADWGATCGRVLTALFSILRHNNQLIRILKRYEVIAFAPPVIKLIGRNSWLKTKRASLLAQQ
jgi:hypothetical protein